jgi:hypothetical protein
MKPKCQFIKYGLRILNICINPLEHIPSDACGSFHLKAADGIFNVSISMLYISQNVWQAHSK